MRINVMMIVYVRYSKMSLLQGDCMKKVIINPGCISCGTCAFTAPEVFEVTDISHVKEAVDLEKNKERIKEAVRKCPVQVITFEE